MDKLHILVDKFKRNKDYYFSARYNETETRREFIDPFFELLGWDMQNNRGSDPRLREVMPESYLGSAGRPDYKFTLSGVGKFFVEAKKPHVKIISEKDAVFQTRSYGWSANHLIAVLTNFEYLLIYDCTAPPKLSDGSTCALLKRYHYTEYEEKLGEIKLLLSRETVYAGLFERGFDSLINTGACLPIDTHFLRQINEWRVKLANYLYGNHAIKNIETINDQTQMFINQMIFLRICEDRNLPIYHKLQQTTENINELKERLLKVFEEADRKYNSGLFRGDYIIFNLSNEIIMNMIMSLYYPQSPYAFNVVDSNLLGRIYEVFLCEKLILNEGKLILSRKTENLNRDIVTTPIEIVKYMTHRTLGQLINGKTPEQILMLRCADIACGSGVFLLETLEYLIQFFIKWYLTNKPNHLIPCENGQYNLPFEEKKCILSSCIYGIDIDTNAVEVTKFSLLLKLLENETHPSLGDGQSLLPSLDENIKAGNALVEFRNMKGENISQGVLESINPFDWNFANGENTFDVIIGNPPYIATDDMITLHTKEELDIYKKYQTAVKQFDKYFIFIERGLAKLKEKGILCFIVPNKFINNKAGEKLREVIGKHVAEFVDFGASQIFKDKSVYSSILMLKKNNEKLFEFERVNDLQEWWANQGKQTDDDKRVILNTNILTKNVWVLVENKGKADLIAKLYENSMYMKEVAEPIAAIQTSAERPKHVYWFSSEEVEGENDSHFIIQRDGRRYSIEKNILKPFFKPIKKSERTITTFDSIQTNKMIIFPYNSIGELYSQSEMQEKFPGTWVYFNDNYEWLVPKQITGKKENRDVPHATKETWYHYGRLQHLTSFINTPKIIVGVLHDKERPLYVYDDKDMLIAAGGTAGYCAIRKRERGYELEYILAILDHPAIEWLCSILGSDFRGDYYSTGTYVLNMLPVRKIDFNNLKQLNNYNQIIEYVKRIYTINTRLLSKDLSLRQKNVFLNEKNNLRSVIRDEVTALYGINGYENFYNEV